MNGNRFDFLELSQAQPADVQSADSPGTDITSDAGGELGRRVDTDGRPIAQVVDTDVRGYRAFLNLQREEALASSLESMATGEEVAYELRAVEVFGSKGIRAGQFNFPGGIAVDSQGVLYVADSYNHRVQRITPDGGVSIIGGRGPGRAQFLSPQGIAIDSVDSFYIVEQGNNRVQKYTAAGTLELVMDAAGHGLGDLYRPTAIAVTQDGEIYVADTGNCRVQRFDRFGNFLSVIGAGPGAGVLTTPQAVSVDRGGNSYVLDAFGYRVVRYDANGRFVSQYGGQTVLAASTDTRARFIEPRAVTVDASGLIYVADAGEGPHETGSSRGRLQAVDPRSGLTLVAIDKLGRNLGCLFRPGGIATTASVDGARGDIYVADTMNHRILRFAWTRLK